MSDSDDTDVLLLIPPDYFTEHGLVAHFQRQQALQLQAAEVLNATISHMLEQNLDEQNASPTPQRAMDVGGGGGGVYDEKVPPTAAYQFLPPNRKAELNHINSRLYEIETNNRDDDRDGGLQNQQQQQQHNHPNHFDAPSDISTISTNTVRTQLGNKQHLPHQHYYNNNNHHHIQQQQQLQQQQQQQQRNGFVHSTPKQAYATNEKLSNGNGNGNIDCRPYRDDGLLLEIDHFLEGGGASYDDGLTKWKHYPYAQQEYRLEGRGRCDSLPAIDRLSMESMPQMSMETDKLARKASTSNDCGRGTLAAASSATNLISLSEIWGKSGQATTIAANGTLKEEQLRRQHLEKTVHQLQSRLLEYQQRLSVAIEVDRAKDTALAKAQMESKGLQAEMQQTRDTLRSLEIEQREHQSKMDEMQKELAQAVSLATKFQEKNEKLETELSVCSRKTNECSNMYKEQVEDLEIKLHACKRSEDFAVNELTRAKDKLVKAEYQAEKLKVRSDELEKECSTLRHQKEMLQEYHQKQKSRADTLEAQKKSLHETLAHLTDNEASLRKKLELQPKTLKSHYQQQLEHVVAQKLKEFQEQLDKTEETLKAEARDRERLIADRAVKQLELINQKNEIELNLLQEKHNEEVALYRIQLANASKRIDDLELKLNCYKSKRADIAEKLHDVMEKQWQQALEILTSPNQSNRIVQTDEEDGGGGDGNSSPDENDDNQGPYDETPKTSKAKRLNVKENNLNVRTNGKGGGAEQTPAPFDRLQAYIELLLSKSPSDFDKLDQILSLTNKAKTTAGKLDRAAALKRIASGKPPWKA